MSTTPWDRLPEGVKDNLIQFAVTTVSGARYLLKYRPSLLTEKGKEAAMDIIFRGVVADPGVNSASWVLDNLWSLLTTDQQQFIVTTLVQKSTERLKSNLARRVIARLTQ